MLYLGMQYNVKLIIFTCISQGTGELLLPWKCCKIPTTSFQYSKIRDPGHEDSPILTLIGLRNKRKAANPSKKSMDISFKISNIFLISI